MDDNIKNSNISQDLFNKLKSAKFIDTKSTIDNIIWINSLFKVYSEYCQQQRNIKMSDETLKLKQQTIDNAKKAEQNNQGNKEVLNKDIVDANTGVKEEDNKLGEIQKNADELKKASEKELKDKQKELEDSKKRIDNIKIPKK